MNARPAEVGFTSRRLSQISATTLPLAYSAYSPNIFLKEMGLVFAIWSTTNSTKLRSDAIRKPPAL